MFKFFRQPKELKGSSLNTLVWKKFRCNFTAMGGLVILLLFVIIAIFGYLITPDSTPFANQQYLEIATLKPGSKVDFLIVPHKQAKKKSWFHKMLFGEPLNADAYPIYAHKTEGETLWVELYTGDTPNDGEWLSFDLGQPHEITSRTFWLGTDRYGRDLLSQLMIGTRVSLSVGCIAIFIALLIGIAMGAVGAYFGRWIDNLIVWIINVVWSIPTILLVIAITFALGKGFWQVFIAVGLTMWVDVARVVRGQILSIKEKEFIEAGRALGFKSRRIIFRHILPNITGPVTVITASNFATAILQEAGLSFLGIGVQPPMPSWGTMIKENAGYLILDNAYMAILPGVAIMLLVLAFMLVGNGLREAIENQ